MVNFRSGVRDSQVAWQLAMPWNARNTHVKDDGWLLCGAKASGLENYARRCDLSRQVGALAPGIQPIWAGNRPTAPLGASDHTQSVTWRAATLLDLQMHFL